jgi:aryl-alcohol dehydrogenase-like predicted oxidoreductase
MSKLGLGTVQFGQAYGVSNAKGQVPPAEAAAILKHAAESGVTLLDTAANYGTAEAVLATLDTAAFRIVTKTINLGNGLDAVLARARQSANMLMADTLLVHAVSNLQDASLWPALQRLKQDGIFRRNGISAYAADDPVALAKRFQPDVMQLPFSILDQRLLDDGTLARLADIGVEIHVRSLFLQGLLFLESPPEALAAAAPDLKRIKSAIATAGLTPLAAALGFVLARPEIAFGIVGVTSLDEMDEIVTAASHPIPDLDWSAMALRDERLLTPSLW